MRRWLASVVVVGVAPLVTVMCSRAPGEDAERVFRQGRWFELREAVTEKSPALLRAAVATAFNDRERAETLLWNIVRSETDAADDAYELLCRIYRRSGQYARLAETHRAWAAAFPDSSGVRRWAEDSDKFSRPDQVNGVRRRSVLRHVVGGYPTVPVSINGIEDDFILDTGAWQSALTEPEAEKLGLEVREATAVLIDASGTPTTFRTAIAEEVVIGAMTFRNVSFAVIPGSSLFGGEELGIVGMPILLAIGSIQWLTDGTVELAGTIPAAAHQVSPNLAFDRTRLLLSAEVRGERVLTTFDTGANSTELNANFAAAFPLIVEREGKRATGELTGVGGSRTFESIELPQLVFRIGATDVTLRPVSVTFQRLEMLGGECCIGNAGHDLLIQGRGFSIDFSQMTLSVH